MDFGPVMSVGLPTTKFRMGAFLSDVNFREFGIIIVDLAVVAQEAHQLAQQGSAAAISRAQYRFSQLNKWISDGHMFIAIVPTSPYIGALGASYQFTDEEVFANVGFPSNAGSRIEYCGPAPGRDLLKDWVERLEYKVTLSAPDLQPLFRVRLARSGNAQLVGGFRKHGGTSSLFLRRVSKRQICTKTIWTH